MNLFKSYNQLVRWRFIGILGFVGAYIFDAMLMGEERWLSKTAIIVCSLGFITFMIFEKRVIVDETVLANDKIARVFVYNCIVFGLLILNFIIRTFDLSLMIYHEHLFVFVFGLIALSDGVYLYLEGKATHG